MKPVTLKPRSNLLNHYLIFSGSPCIDDQAPDFHSHIQPPPCSVGMTHICLLLRKNGMGLGRANRRIPNVLTAPHLTQPPFTRHEMLNSLDIRASRDQGATCQDNGPVV